jgi:hypothetical protein
MTVFSRAARSVWGDMIQEHFNVDSAGEMNDLASLLLRGGDKEAEMPIKAVSYRQFLPASHMVCQYCSYCSSIFCLAIHRSGAIEHCSLISLSW